MDIKYLLIPTARSGLWLALLRSALPVVSGPSSPASRTCCGRVRNLFPLRVRIESIRRRDNRRRTCCYPLSSAGAYVQTAFCTTREAEVSRSLRGRSPCVFSENVGQTHGARGNDPSPAYTHDTFTRRSNVI